MNMIFDYDNKESAKDLRRTKSFKNVILIYIV